MSLTFPLLDAVDLEFIYPKHTLWFNPTLHHQVLTTSAIEGNYTLLSGEQAACFTY